MRLYLPVVVALAVCSGGCEIVASPVDSKVWREDKRFAVSGTPQVELQTFDGSIEVRPGTGSEVVVTIERRAGSEEAAKSLEVTADQSGNHITVKAVQPPHHTFSWGTTSRSVSFVVVVPPRSDIEARSGDGSIRIDGVSGTVKSHTGDGSIKLAQVNGAIDVSSGDGSIAVAGKISQLHARSGDGSVTIEAAPGSATTDEWDVSTGDGSVTMQLPADFGAELDAHTGDGGIRLQDVTVSNVSGEIGRNTVRGRLGNGGKPMRVRTGDGSITFRRN